MPTVTYTNAQYVYINNQPFAYPTEQTATNLITGYHYIPKLKWRDWLTPAQWQRLNVMSSKYRVVNLECTIQNLIPITDQVAIQATNTFSAFNNTIYAICYDDTEGYFPEPNNNWTDWSAREGQALERTTNTVLPYLNYQTGFPAKRHPDPLIAVERIMELRPGKNAVKYSQNYGNCQWMHTHQGWRIPAAAMSDSTDQSADITQFGHDTNLTGSMYNQYMHNATGHYMGMRRNFPRTQADILKYNEKESAFETTIEHTWMIKMIPLFDSKGALINAQGQCMLYKKITIEYVPYTAISNLAMEYYNITSEAIREGSFGPIRKFGPYRMLSTIPINDNNDHVTPASTASQHKATQTQDSDLVEE